MNCSGLDNEQYCSSNTASSGDSISTLMFEEYYHRYAGRQQAVKTYIGTLQSIEKVHHSVRSILIESTVAGQEKSMKLSEHIGMQEEILRDRRM
jgi:hypothetical protein